MKKPIKSNKELMEDSMGTHGRVRLTVSFSVGAVPLRGHNLVLAIKDPALTNALIEEVAKQVREVIKKG